MDGTILLADDDRSIRTVLTQALLRAGCKVHATGSLKTLKQWVAEGRGDVVISDVVMPDGNGLDVLPHITRERPNLPVIVISAQSTMETAIKANRLEAFEYLAKPFDLPKLLKCCSDALAQGRRRHDLGRGADQGALDGEDVGSGDKPALVSALSLIGKSPHMQELYRQVAQVLNARMPLMLYGESGSGKTSLARAIHGMSQAKNDPFETFFPEAFEEGAPLRSVQTGSVVLEHIDMLSRGAQVRLLMDLDRLEAKKIRVMTTMSVPAERLIEHGMLPALYYRLCGAVLPLPALRLRERDIIRLALYFLAEDDARVDISQEGQQLLLHYAWPGNVHQLRHVMSYAKVLSGGEIIQKDYIEQALSGQIHSRGVPAQLLQSSYFELSGVSAQGGHRGAQLRADESNHEGLERAVAQYLERFIAEGSAAPADLTGQSLYERAMALVERPLLEKSMVFTGGNQAKSAQLLGLNRNTLRKKIVHHDIRVTRYPKMS